MKRIAVILLVATSTACADIGVVVLSTGVVVAKEVYAGNTTDLNAYLAKRQAGDPSLSFTLIFLPNAAFDATSVPINQALFRSDAIRFLNDASGLPKFIRAVLLVILDEINTLRIAASLPPRTPAQMVTAIQTKLNSGAAD